MKKQILSIILLAGLMSLLAGCETTFEQKGRDVKFTASSRGSVSTKTAYGAETTDGYAIIKWKADDQIRIYSPNTTYLIGSAGSAEVVVGAGDGQTQYPVVYDDYTLVPGDITNGHIHNATLENVQSSSNEDGRGLYWNVSGGSSGQANFYSAYPTNVGISWYSGGLSFDVNIPNDQDPFAETPKPQFNTLPLLAMQSGVTSGQSVNLEFYPAFTAFEFNLKSEDLITLNSFTLETSSDECWVTGTCFYNPALKEQGAAFYLKNDQIYFVAPIPDAPTYWNNTSYELCNKSLTINFPPGTQIGPAVGDDPAKEVTFTLYALPNDLDQMSITVNLTANDGPGGAAETRSRKLKLQKKETSDGPYEWITFPAGHKAKIIGLAVDKGTTWKYKIQVDPNQLPWDLTTESTTFSQNIQASAFNILNATETENHYYPAGTKDYQVRTLDMSKDYGETAGVPNKPYFEVTFKPMAPLGGYWRLIPESNGGMGTGAFTVEVIDSEGNGSTDLTGHIMNLPVTLHITSMVTDDQRTEDHAIIFKSYFSTSVNFEENSTYSADSEIQDVHKDGSFSYWRFVIPAKTN